MLHAASKHIRAESGKWKAIANNIESICIGRVHIRLHRSVPCYASNDDSPGESNREQPRAITHETIRNATNSLQQGGGATEVAGTIVPHATEMNTTLGKPHTQVS